MAQAWDETSYFIERKPQSVAANVFMSSPAGLKMHKTPIHDEVAYVQKTFHRLALEIPTFSLDEYVKDAKNKDMTLKCNQCELVIVEKKADTKRKITTFPADDWLETSPSMEYFCYNTCGEACAPSGGMGNKCGQGKDGRHHVREHEGLLGISTMKDAIKNWLPSENHVIFADSFVLLHKTDHLDKKLVNEHGAFNTLKCARCLADLGYALRKYKHVYKLFLTSTDMTFGDQIPPCIPARYETVEKYFSWLLLQRSEAESSLKLVIRSTEKKPHMLIWILDSYYIMTLGKFQKDEAIKPPSEDGEAAQEKSPKTPTEDGSNGELKIEIPEELETEIFQAPSFTAIKVLYKVFDEETALSDPRATGGDASIGFVDMPTNSAMKLMEIIMNNSMCLPPMCRAIGQFYVGFMRLSDKHE